MIIRAIPKLILYWTFLYFDNVIPLINYFITFKWVSSMICLRLRLYSRWHGFEHQKYVSYWIHHNTLQSLIRRYWLKDSKAVQSYIIKRFTVFFEDQRKSLIAFGDNFVKLIYIYSKIIYHHSQLSLSSYVAVFETLWYWIRCG